MMPSSTKSAPLEVNTSDNNRNLLPDGLLRQSSQSLQFIETFLPEECVENNGSDDRYRSGHDKQKDQSLDRSILKNKTSYQLSNMNDMRKSMHEASIRIKNAPLLEHENRFSEVKDVDKVGGWSTTKEEIDKQKTRNGFVQSLKKSLLKPFSRTDFNENETDHSSVYKPRLEESYNVIESSTHTVKEGVHFSFVEVREYLYTIGLTPGCSRGVPLTIEWDSFSLTKVAFDEYEQKREPQRRELKELRIPKDVRVELLLDLGHSMKEIRDTIKMNKALRIQQLETKQNLYKMPKEEKWERYRRYISSVFTNRKKKERKFMEFAYSFKH